MTSDTRKSNIKQMLLQKSFVSVSEMAELFTVTEETIRRDLRMLEKEGIISRTHGGAVLKDKVSSSFERQEIRGILQASKSAMADTAKHFVQNGFCIFMDSSTTVQNLFPQIQDLQLTIVTDSIDIIIACSNLPNIKLYALGGIYNPRTRCFSSSLGRDLLSNLYFDIAFISCRTISSSEGLCDSNIEEASTKRLAGQHASKTIAMVDHTKFDRVSFARICGLEDIDVLISDKPIAPSWEQVLREKQVEVLISRPQS